MNNPLVSICIPTYNQTDLLKKTLDSVFAQDFADYEVIISDDSTTNDVEKLAATYPQEKIHYLRNKPSLGSPANWNKSISEARGSYIKILHHDDWFAAPQSLSEFVAHIKENPQADFFFSAAEVFDIKKNKQYLYIPSKRKISAILKNPLLLMTGNTIGTPSVTFFKKTSETFDTHLKWLVDLDFYIRLIQKNTKCVFVPKPLIHVSIGADEQISQKCRNKEVEFGEWFYVYKKYRGDQKFTFREKVHLFKLVHRYKIESIEILQKIAEVPNENTLKNIIRINRYL